METKEIIESLRLCAEKLGCHRYIVGNCVENISFGKVLDEAAERLEELEKQLSQQQPEWISVEDRLPEEKQELFMCLMEREYFLVLRGFYANSEWYVYTGVNLYTQCDDIPSFWVPASIIEPPKPKEPTFKDVFLKAFPKAPIDEDGIPKACIADVFPWVKHKHCDGWMCFEDWNQSYFEEEEKE